MSDRIRFSIKNGALIVTADGWPGLRIGPARCRVMVDGKAHNGRLMKTVRKSGKKCELVWRFGASGMELSQAIVQETQRRLSWKNILVNHGKKTRVLNYADLLAINSVRGERFDLGAHPAQVRVLENNPKRGQVRSVGQIMTGMDGRRALGGAGHRAFCSEAVTVLYSEQDGAGLLMGFESFDRFAGVIQAGAGESHGKSAAPLDNVDKGAIGPSRVSFGSPKLRRGDRFSKMSIGLPGADVPVASGDTVQLEEFVFEVGADPYRLLDDYADRVAVAYKVKDIPKPFVNWCSWYSHRLGVTEEKVLANARAAKERRLDELGLRFMQVDLGWQKNNMPTFFEENERFARGLKWLSDQLGALGFELGVWGGFTCVSENHPIATAHPEWLVQDESGKPRSKYRWFWEPHDRIHDLDVSHPGAREWIRENIESLAKKGVRYLKWDFGGNITLPGKRHNPNIACSRANEGMRLAGQIVREAMNSQGKEALILDVCDGETANLGNLQLLYTIVDTGNTGLGFSHLRNIYTALGTHLFKNQRWGLIQPSCLVTGLPGTIEEARMRVTAAFMSAGHVDISDDLTTLPEERWDVLLSALPPVSMPARVVDLFHPVRIQASSYESLCRGVDSQAPETHETQGAVVWHMPVKADWDQWELVAFFHFFEPEAEGNGGQVPLRFTVDFKHLGFNQQQKFWGYEFWGKQFMGSLPVPRRPDGDYRHPGDSAVPVNDSGPGVLDVNFQGPAVKLLVLRKPRKHPWPIGTTFHLSGGLELSKVRWHKARGILSGELHRPPGQSGAMVIAGAQAAGRIKAMVDGKTVPTHRGANGSLHVPVITHNWKTKWSVTFTGKGGI